jgi:hypothetical protein
MKGFTMLQKQVGTATVGVLSVHGDYGKVPPGQLEPMLPVPGQPTVIYPVGGGNGSTSLSFIKGGKVDYKRLYPSRRLIRNHRSYTISELGNMGENLYTPEHTVVVAASANITADGGFIDLDSIGSWIENSPLPPGMRYLELNDILGDIFAASHGSLVGKNIGDFFPPIYTIIADPFTDYDSFLPHAGFVSPLSPGTIRTNIKALPGSAWFNLYEIYSTDFSYWTGELSGVDPLTWQDDFWDGLDRDPTGNTPRVDRKKMKDWLLAHPDASPV